MSQHFQHWYPTYASYFGSVVDGDCQFRYQAFIDPSSCQGDECNYLAARTVDCIYGHTTQSILADCAAAGIVLGLLPTILSFAGSSTLETGLLAMRRPFLAFLLSTTSPGSNPLRASQYQNAASLLEISKEGRLQVRVPASYRTLMSLLEYLVALAAVANLITVLYDLSIKSVCSVGTNTYFLPGTWALISTLVHVLGALCLRLRMNPSLTHADNWRQRWFNQLREEMSLCETHDECTIICRKETVAFLCLQWFSSTLCICNIVFGTAVLSSVLFIGTRDAIQIAARLLASTLIARLVLVFELAGMSNTIVAFEDRPSLATVEEGPVVRMDGVKTM